VKHRLDDLGLDALTVTRWAVEQGLLAAVVRGRVSGHVVDAYATHHRSRTP
jgi:hypothetical protein